MESQLGRVREQIEVQEGRLRYLSDRIALATVTIRVEERRDYTPPQAPTFATRAQQTFQGSLHVMQQAGEAIALLAIALGPWLVITGVFFGLPGLWWLRKRGKRKNLERPFA